MPRQTADLKMISKAGYESYLSPSSIIRMKSESVEQPTVQIAEVLIQLSLLSASSWLSTGSGDDGDSHA